MTKDLKAAKHWFKYAEGWYERAVLNHQRGWDDIAEDNIRIAYERLEWAKEYL